MNATQHPTNRLSTDAARYRALRAFLETMGRSAIFQGGTKGHEHVFTPQGLDTLADRLVAERSEQRATLDELRACVTSAGPWFTVPAGTREADCQGCDASVYWITTTGHRRMPVDCDVPGGERPTLKDRTTPSDAPGPLTYHDGRGVSHFATCPSAGQFRRGKP